jgi:hypothetical protein
MVRPSVFLTTVRTASAQLLARVSQLRLDGEDELIVTAEQTGMNPMRWYL